MTTPSIPNFPIDIRAASNREIKYPELAKTVTLDQLASITHISINFLLSLLDGLTDADVTFAPIDEMADDPYATEGEEDLGWNFAHLIAHVTASCEEGASISSRLARGVAVSGRDRYETPWQEITTVAQCRQRLEESRRMRLASLQVWPDEPQLDVYRDKSPRFEAIFGRMNAISTYLFDIAHEIGHYDQLLAVRSQAIAAREIA
jgi:hypothetical protein